MIGQYHWYSVPVYTQYFYKDEVSVVQTMSLTNYVNTCHV